MACDPITVTTRRWVTVVLVVVAIGVVVVVAAVRTPAPDGSMLTVSPGGTVELAALDERTQLLYQDVAADTDAMGAVRCYCGCEAMLGHRHLLDCFVRPDDGWERHAVGCGICQVEARAVLAARAAGTPLGEIVAAIDATYAGITTDQEIDDR